MNTESVWSGLGVAAQSGNLVLERGTASRCATKCGELIDQLDGLRDSAVRLAKIDGFGSLPSGLALAAKFERKASGGDYALDQAIADHIRTVAEIRDVFLQIEARYTEAEEANTAATTAVGSQIN
ncbi:hypothetical protein EGT67_17735 [Prescottella agglutinans]|uniref:Uncharacterized protein n=1 Tax=Prescottella agglutinans TaxID=1644129 RepID=A0A438BBQ4_9NOCA|nr:hypothetical protein [Prescottella agglutinans]RVW08352.1 hypothetical protein EGT67_17735 [Prescottella agglutinans]